MSTVPSEDSRSDGTKVMDTTRSGTTFTCQFECQHREPFSTSKACPPPNAEQGEFVLFRALSGRSPRDSDFKPDVDARRRANLNDCRCWGFSVWVTKEDVEHAFELQPEFEQKCIASGKVCFSDGALAHTQTKRQAGHHTFWPAIGADLAAKFAVVCNKKVWS